jgi:N-acetylneuraminic acid mutarotase
MIVAGGYNNSYQSIGGIYNPINEEWQLTSAVGAPVRRDHSAVWTGSEMIVWGGWFNEGLNTGAIYNPVSDDWNQLSLTGAPEARQRNTVIWADDKMIIWGGYSNNSELLNSGGIYYPENDLWTDISTDGVPDPRSSHSVVLADDNMIIWGGINNSNGFQYLDSGGVYNISEDSWLEINQDGAPSARFEHTAVWANNQMIIWGGFERINGVVQFPTTGGAYNPITMKWENMEVVGSPVGRNRHSAVWTGNEMIVWGGFYTMNTFGTYVPPEMFSIGGELLGLIGDGISLRLNSNEDLLLVENDLFTFNGLLFQGSEYEVVVVEHPNFPLQTCIVEGGRGFNISTNISDIQIICGEFIDLIYSNGFETATPN